MKILSIIIISFFLVPAAFSQVSEIMVPALYQKESPLKTGKLQPVPDSLLTRDEPLRAGMGKLMLAPADNMIKDPVPAPGAVLNDRINNSKAILKPYPGITQ